MPTGPKGERRSADVISNAVKVIRVLTVDDREAYSDVSQKNQAALSVTLMT